MSPLPFTLLWNVGLATALAVLVGVACKWRVLQHRPALAHTLWLLVLAKLITPPLIPLPVLSTVRADLVIEHAQLSGHFDAVKCVAFSPDGKMLASGSEDQNVRLWDVMTRKPGATLNHTEAVRCLAFSPDGMGLASGSAGLDRGARRCTGGVRVWNPVSGQELRRLEGHEGWVCAVAYSPDGKILAAAGNGGASNVGLVTLWESATGAKRANLEGHTKCVDGVAFSPDGKTLATGSRDFTVKLWDWGAQKEILNLDNGGNSHQLAFSPDGKTLATTGVQFKLTLWDVETGNKRTTFESKPNGIAFSPDGKTIATGHYVSAPADGEFTMPTGAVKIWDLATTALRQAVDVDGVVQSVAFSPDGKLLAAGCRGREKQPLGRRIDDNGNVTPAVQGEKAGSVRLWSVNRP